MQTKKEIISPENVVEYAKFIAQSKKVIKLSRPLKMNQLGSQVFYYSVVGGQAYVSCLLGPLCEFLKEVKINKEAFIDLITFQFLIPDNTVFENMKTIPAGAILYPSGQIEKGDTLEMQSEINDVQKASQMIIGELKKSLTV